MKRFIKNILILIIPFLVGVLLIFKAPYSKEFAYSFRKNVDCNTSWIYYRLFQNNKPIDVAFMGTSHTGCGINDSLIERLVNIKDNQNLIVSNLAYCTIGRNIQLPLVKDLIETKQPKLIVMEVTEKESKSSHKDFGYIADIDDVIENSKLFNTAVISDLYSSFYARFSYTRKRLSNTLKSGALNNHLSTHSYFPFKFTADESFLKEHKKKQYNRYEKNKNNLLSNLESAYPKFYLNEIVEIAKANNVNLVFLYLPSFGTSLDLPLDYEFYSEYGHVLIPPKKIFNNPNLWVDGEHLNYDGSKVLGEWLANQMANDDYLLLKQ
jgi:hypothetical protein